jgi:hypothetical protein
MKPVLFSSRKISSILMLLLSLLISIALGAWNSETVGSTVKPSPLLTPSDA